MNARNTVEICNVLRLFHQTGSIEPCSAYGVGFSSGAVSSFDTCRPSFASDGAAEDDVCSVCSATSELLAGVSMTEYEAVSDEYSSSSLLDATEGYTGPLHRQQAGRPFSSHVCRQCACMVCEQRRSTIGGRFGGVVKDSAFVKQSSFELRCTVPSPTFSKSIGSSRQIQQVHPDAYSARESDAGNVDAWTTRLIARRERTRGGRATRTSWMELSPDGSE